LCAQPLGAPEPFFYNCCSGTNGPNGPFCSRNGNVVSGSVISDATARHSHLLIPYVGTLATEA